MPYLHHGLTDYKSMIVIKTETNFLQDYICISVFFKQKL